MPHAKRGEEKLTPIGPGRMAQLGLGWVGFQIFWAFHSGALPLFLRGFTDSKLRISLVLGLAGVAGCLVPSLVGALSDRSRSRFGRRRPFVLAGFSIVLLCLLELPSATGFGFAAMVTGLSYFAMRFAETPYLALLPDVTPPEQRSTASGAMNLFGSIGLIFCFLLSRLVWDTHPDLLIRLVGASAFLAVLVSAFLLEENAAGAREENALGENASGALGEATSTVAPPAHSARLRSYLQGLAAERNALLYFAASSACWLGFWMVSSFATLFVVEELGVEEGRSFTVLLPFTLVATLCALPLGMLGDRFGRKPILTITMLLWALSELAVGLSQDFTQAVVTVAITAVPFAAFSGVGYAYMLDLVPRARTAEFVGLSVIAGASAQIVGSLLGGLLIDRLGYRSIFPVTAAAMLLGCVLLQRTRPRPDAPEAISSAPKSS